MCLCYKLPEKIEPIRASLRSLISQVQSEKASIFIPILPEFMDMPAPIRMQVVQDHAMRGGRLSDHIQRYFDEQAQSVQIPAPTVL